MLKSIPDLIEGLGGNSEVARLVGVSLPAISNAKKRGELPHAWRLPLYRIAEERGLKVDPAVFGIDISPASSGEAAA